MKLNLRRVVQVLAAVLLAGGSGLLVRGQAPQAAGTWASTGAVPDARLHAASTALPDGRTLIAGGYLDGAPTASIVVFDPVVHSFATAGAMSAARVGHTATVLADGRVLIAGGLVGGVATPDLEIFDPADGTSGLIGTMDVARSGHAAALLDDGTVLLVGGSDGTAALASGEIFHADSNATTSINPMSVGRAGASATTLIDNRVLVAGGNDGTQDLATAEIFNPWSESFEAVGTGLSLARSGHSAVLLPHNAGVLIAGGSTNGVPQIASDLFLPAIFTDPYSYAQGAFVGTGALETPRMGAIAGPEGDNGYAFVAGGGSVDQNGQSGVAANAERYRFATIKTDKDDYAPGEHAIITGSGWQPGEQVTFLFQEDPAVHDDYAFPVTADSEGKIYWDQWAPEEHDLNVRFYLTAQDSRSRAQTTFTDSRTITNVLLNGGTSVTVAPGASIGAQVFVTTDNSGGNSNWRSTSWRIATTPPGSTTCVDTPNHDGAGSSSETFNITAPGSAGTYNAYFLAHRDDACVSAQQSNLWTMVGSVIVDATSPTVSSINRVASSPTNAGSVQWAVTFSESVTSVDASDFALVASGLTSTNITSVTGSGSSYTVTANTGNGTGTMGLNLVDDDSIQDAAANKLGGTGAANGNFTGQVYTIDRTLTPTITAANKVYDGNATASILTRGFTSALPVTEDVSVTGGSATFANKNAGTGKTVTATGLTLTGTGTAKYVLSSTNATTTADITGRALTVTATGVNRMYDGTMVATISLTTDKVSGDDVTASSSSATFADKHVGTGKSVSVSGISISGADAGNYTLSNTTASTTANITARPLTVTATGANKVYDGTTAATVNLTTDKILGDDVTTNSASAAFVDKNVGTGKTINVSGIVIGGADATNYHLSNTTASTTANITARTLTVTATGVNKIYDGSAAATVTLSADKVAGDEVAPAFTSAAFADKNVGTGKTVSVSGISVSGGDAGNYTLGNSTATATADITTRTLHVSAVGVSRAYNGGTAATVSLSDDRVSNDDLVVSYASASFADKHVGTGKAISVTGVSITGGTDAGNYSLASTGAAATADISPRPLAVTATGVNKVYDGTANATVTLSDDRVAGDALMLEYSSASFADKHVASGKPINVTGININGGADAVDYSPSNTTASTAADITARTLTISAATDTKVYDGTTASSATPIVSGLQTGDTTTGLVQTFESADAGARTLSVTAYTVTDGNGGNNYSIALESASGTIDQAPVTATAGGGSATYDGSAKTPAACVVSGPYTGGLTCANNPATVGPDAGTFPIAPVVSGTGLSNFAITVVNGSYTISQASSTTTIACPPSVVYNGVTQTPCTATVTGAGGLNQSVTVAHSNNTDVGTATASATFAGDTNHTGSSDTKTFAITQAPVTATAGSGSATFDGSTHAPSACTVTGGYAGDLTCTNNPASVGPDAGIFPIAPVVTGTGLSNFAIAVVDGSYTISQASSTTAITCPTSVVYNGVAQAPCTATVIGAGGLNQSVTVTYTDNVTVGTATASATFAGDANHTGSSDSKTFAITQAPVTATAGSGSATFDGSTHAPSACTVTGVYTGDLSCTNNPATVGPDAGTSPIAPVVSGTGLSNFAITLVNGSYTIAQASSTTTITCPASVVYNGTAQTPCTATVTGAGGLNQSVALVHTNNTAAGTATATATFAGDTNHSSSSDTKTFQIAKAPLTVTAADKSKIYGDANPTLTATFAGLVGGETPASIGLAVSLNTAAGVASPVGDYAITVSGPMSTANYGPITYPSGTLKIMPAPLTVTSNNGARPYGVANPPFTGSIVGIKNGDNITATHTSTANATTPVGVYGPPTSPQRIQAVLSDPGSKLANYTVDPHDGTLTIGAWSLLGFYQPVGIPNSIGTSPGAPLPMPIAGTVWNTIKGGQTVPLKFELFATAGGTEFTSTSQVQGFTLASVACSAGAEDPVDGTFTTTGGTTLRYDATEGQFIQNWDSPKGAGKCYRVAMTASDGSSITTFFKTK